ncbi:UNVERIFIED_CONTAM: Polyadenylation and cleavage factor4 [Sesamum radiatum]|uniref:Polyadenylation and cleavage factor4 n=1 Tax=Sesamum radiatum TaxID=300843 RepID=A0AAW2SHW8_SESRA
MDRTSRFQNAVPLSSGSLSKAPQIQNDGVGMKPMPPSILDRFRAMVKEREEELRVFSGGPLGMDEIVRLYEIVLSELTINSKPIITDLTIIAGEQRAHGEGIADAICARIIEVFCEAYAQVHPSMHQAMRHLFGTWSAVFPSSVLQIIEAQLQFSPSVNGQSSGLGASTRSESPRPTHGIHINPKYLEAQRQFGHSTVGTEGLSSTGRAGITTSGLDAVKKSLPSASRITRSSSPYRVGHAGSLSPSLEEFSMDSSPTRVAIGASPSGQGIDYGLSRVMGREEETSEWRTKNWHGTSNQHLKASAAHKYSNGVDLRGPRALISAYGIDEREKHLKPRNQLDTNGADQKVGMRTWQNTEEEEFDWEDMTPALADRRQSNEIYSSLPPPGNVAARNSFSTNHAASLVTDYRGNLSKAQFPSVTNFSVIENVSHISSGRGSINKIVDVLPNVAGPSDLPSQIPPSFRESLILPHLQSQSHLNAKGGGSFSESRHSLTGGEQKLPLIDNFSNTDGKLGGPSSIASTFSSAYDTPIPDIRTAHDAALTKAWRPAKFQNPHMPSLSALPPQMHIRGQFGMKTAPNIVVDQGLNKTIYSEQHLGTARNMPQVTLPLIPSQRPGLIPVNLQGTAQPSLAQSMAQGAGQLPSSVPTPSNTMVPPKSYGYLAHAQGPPIGTTSLSNIVPGVQSSLPVLNAPNMSFHVPGAALQPLPGVPLPGTSQALPSGQTIGRAAPGTPGGGALSGLISSLVAQGLISLKKQDSVGLEFDQDSLKVRHESTITALYADLPRQCKTCGLRFKSQEEHSKHMDWHVNKNRTLKTRKTKPSPKWFVSVSMWLSGAEALGTESVPGFLPAENTLEKTEDEEMAVPADEDQNACALCGEPFDDFYSDEMEEWMYKGAVYMYAPAGSIVGMDRSQLGPIVHAKCRSDSHGIPPEEKDERESTEEGSQRKRKLESSQNCAVMENLEKALRFAASPENMSDVSSSIGSLSKI